MNSNDTNSQVMVVNIKYGRKIDTRHHKQCPEMTVLDIPEHIMKMSADTGKFYDAIESYVYNAVTKRFGSECTYCQTYLTF